MLRGTPMAEDTSDSIGPQYEPTRRGLGERIEGPGCVLAIPIAVWDSWQRRLGTPDLLENADGTFSLDWDDGPQGVLRRGSICSISTCLHMRRPRADA
jgi:hypothetical protein